QRQEHFGETGRKDAWWVGPLLTFLGLLAFVIYATVRAFQGNYFEIRNHWSGADAHPVAPYLSPFYSPLFYDKVSPHAWSTTEKPGWWPGGIPFSAALLILGGPVLFR